MDYFLRNIREIDKDFIYDVKKTSIYHYVDKIWGWDEDYQVNDFDTDFNLKDFKIICVSNENIGFVQINEDTSNVNISEIHILSKYRGLGVGSSVIKNIISQAIGNGKSVTIGSFIDNIRARSLYEKLGFQIVKITDTHFAMVYVV